MREIHPWSWPWRLHLALAVCLVALATGVAVAKTPEFPPPEEDGFFGFKVEMEKRGARVSFVFDDSPAEAAGLRPDDLILTLDGKPLGGLRHDQMHEVVAEYRIGDRVPLAVAREDRVVRLVVTLGPTPAEFQTTVEAQERFHRAMREHEALEQLDRLMRRASVLLVRRSDEEGFLVRPARDGSDWESLHPNLRQFFNRYLNDAVARLEGSRVLRIRAVEEEDGIHLEVIPPPRDSS